MSQPTRVGSARRMLAVFGAFMLVGPLASTVLLDGDDVPSDATASLSRTQVNAIFSQVQRLGSYASKPDCFRDVASALQLRCGQELEVDVDERVQAAISMTLCEIATARRHAAPLECSPFVSPPNAILNLSSGTERAESQASCVEALSRSAQFWSSYSGYLREIPQLCYAFGKWVEIDAAKTLYKNATMEKLALLRMLRDREISIIRHEQGFVESVERLNETILSLRYIFFNLEEFLETFKQSVGSSWSQVENMFARWREQRDQSLAVQHTRTAEFSIMLASSVQKHDASISALLSSLETSIVAIFHEEQQKNDVRARQMDVILAETLRRWGDLDVWFSQLQSEFNNFASVTGSAIMEMHQAGQAASDVRNKIDESTGMAQGLSTMLEDLTSSTIADMRKLNQTARELAAELASGSKSSFLYPVEWWKDAIIYGLRVTVGDTGLNGVATFRAINGLALVLRTLWSLVSMIGVSLGGTLLIAVSTSQWTARKYETHRSQKGRGHVTRHDDRCHPSILRPV